MPALSRAHLLDALGLEGEVTVFRPTGERYYHVYFRVRLPQGVVKQINRSTGQEDYQRAKMKAAEIFAEVVRAPKEEADVAELKAVIADLRACITNMQKSGREGGQPALPLVRKKKLRPALQEFLAAKKKVSSFHHYDSLSWRCRRFVAYCETRSLEWFDAPSDSACAKWLDSCKVSAKTRRNYHGDICSFFSWGVEAPRKWRAENPMAAIKLARIKTEKIPVGLDDQGAARFLHGIEDRHPEFASFYAVCLLCGVRADKRDSEMTRLAADVHTSGWKSVLVDNHLVISKPKAGPPRRIKCPPNLAHWVTCYPQLNVPTQWEHQQVIKEFGLPLNALRHTGMTAHIKIGGSLADGAIAFGTSEKMMRKHYLTPLTKEQADAIYAILPKRKASSVATPSTMSLSPEAESSGHPVLPSSMPRSSSSPQGIEAAGKVPSVADRQASAA